MSILITGGSGLLAVNAAATLRDCHRVTLGMHERHISMSGVETVSVNLDSVDSVCATLEMVRPKLVIHTVALTSVEECEADSEGALNVNVRLAGNVAEACMLHGIALAHISTDHLFPGTASKLDEESRPHPLNKYGQTKALAELEVLRHFPTAMVIRTNFYGWGTAYRRSFSDHIIDSLRCGESVSLFADVFYTPILIEVLVKGIVDLYSEAAFGIFNIVGDERISKFEFGVRLAREFELDSRLILPTRIADVRGLAPRPLDMSLDNSKASRLLNRNFGSVDMHLSRLREQEISGIAKELISLRQSKEPTSR